MRFTLMLAAGVLVASSAAYSDSQVIPEGAIDDVVSRVTFGDGNAQPGQQGEVKPRRTVQKRVWVSMPRDGEVQFYVKFNDQARARLNPDGSLRSDGGAVVGDAEAVARKWGLELQPMFEQDIAILQRVEQRALEASGIQPPDLAGMMQVVWPENLTRQQVELAANELNQCLGVEFVELQAELKLHSNSAAAPVAGQTMQKAMAAATTALAEMNLPPNLTADQRQNLFFDDLNGNGFFDYNRLTTPYFLSGEYVGGVDVPAFWEIGAWILDNNLHHSSWNPNRNGGRGAKINVGVIEFNANLDHVDLVDVKLEPGVELLPPQLGGFSHWNHGTATLGIIVARDHGLPGPDRFVQGDNAEVGMIGIAPEAQGWFFPTAAMHGGSRLPSAILSALDIFSFGDVLSFSIGPGNGTLLVSEANATLFQMANQLGIMVCMSAGNDCFDLDGADYPLGDTGAIVVGAGHPIRAPAGPCWGYFTARPHVRHDFSNYFTDETDRVHVQAWGANVGTLGYADLFGDPNDLETANFWYTNQFGGTSAACPMIAGVVVCVQGLSKMFFGAPLGPSDARAIAIGTQLAQDAQPVTPFIFGVSEDPEECGGFCVIGNCLEFCYDPLEDPRRIGGFPKIRDYPWVENQQFGDGMNNSLNVINDLFNLNTFGSVNLDQFAVITGRLINGSLASLQAIDGSYMLVKSDFRNMGPVSNTDPFPTPVYFFIGQFTDVGVIKVVSNPGDVTNVRVETHLATDAGGIPVVSAEVYDQVNSRWEWLGFPPELFGSVPSTYIFPASQHGQQYVNLNNGRMLARVWVYSLGFSTRMKFNTAYDLIDIAFDSTGFGGGADL